MKATFEVQGEAVVKAKIEVQGKALDDLGQGIERALELIRQGFTSGQDRNDTGSFLFEVEGSDE